MTKKKQVIVIRALQQRFINTTRKYEKNFDLLSELLLGGSPSIGIQF